MLLSLNIQNYVLIDKLHLSLDKGLTVFSGETGAGKSIILDALSLCLGARATRGGIKVGAEQASITATFKCLPEVKGPLTEAGITLEDEELIIRRVMLANGSNKVFINDQPCSLALVKQVGSQLMEIHQQFDRLMDPQSHLQTLDDLLEDKSLLEKTRGAAHTLHKAEKHFNNLMAKKHEAEQHADYVRHAVAELEKADVQPNEEDELAARKQTLKDKEKVIESLDKALEYLSGTQGIEEKFSKLSAALGRLNAVDIPVVAELIERCNQTHEETLVLSQEINQLLQNFTNDDSNIETVDERLFLIRQLARKYNVLPCELPEKLEEFRAENTLIENIDQNLHAAQKDLKAAEQHYETLATQLHKARTQTAQRMEEQIHQELAPLSLERCQFKVALEALPREKWGATGFSKAEFVIDTNGTGQFGPLQKIASGGEMARIMLALKVVLARQGSLPTLIFDEVDSGVGGATAAAVGERLHKLAQNVQVLVITHSPQVAGFAAHHFKVQKDAASKEEMVQTTVIQLEADERLREVARMISGKALTEESLNAARQLLQR